MKQVIYGLVDSNGNLIDVSTSLRGAKIIATREGYRAVGKRNVVTGAVSLAARKNKNDVWENLV